MLLVIFMHLGSLILGRLACQQGEIVSRGSGYVEFRRERVGYCRCPKTILRIAVEDRLIAAGGTY